MLLKTQLFNNVMTKIRRTKLKHALLATLAVSGVLTLAVMAPNAVQLLRYVIKTPRQRRNRFYYIRSTVHQMSERGLVSLVKNQGGQTMVRLTAKGRTELKRYALGDLKIDKPKRWDGKYRLIIFDIKEWKRKTRDDLRQWLEHLGFEHLQNSVWVFPYPCREIIVLLKSNFKIGKEVLYVTADEIENDGWLRRKFNLDE